MKDGRLRRECSIGVILEHPRDEKFEKQTAGESWEKYDATEILAIRSRDQACDSSILSLR